MPDFDLSQYNSSKFANIKDSIAHSKGNKLVISNLSTVVNFDDKFILQESHYLQDYEYQLSQYYYKTNLPSDLHYRPEYASYQLYGTTDLWYVLLFINGMTHFSQFKTNTINVLTPEGIIYINTIIESNKKRIANNINNPLVVKDLTLKKI